jgi:hypothetical protein
VGGGCGVSTLALAPSFHHTVTYEGTATFGALCAALSWVDSVKSSSVTPRPCLPGPPPSPLQSRHEPPGNPPPFVRWFSDGHRTYCPPLPSLPSTCSSSALSVASAQPPSAASVSPSFLPPISSPQPRAKTRSLFSKATLVLFRPQQRSAGYWSTTCRQPYGPHATNIICYFQAKTPSPPPPSSRYQVLPPWTLRLVASAAGLKGNTCLMMQLHHMHPLTPPLPSTSQKQNRISLPKGTAITLPPPPLLVLYILSDASKRSSISRCSCPPHDASCVILPASLAIDSDRVQSTFHRMFAPPPPLAHHPTTQSTPSMRFFNTLQTCTSSPYATSLSSAWTHASHVEPLPLHCHRFWVTLYAVRRSSIAPAPLSRARVASSDSPLPSHLRLKLGKAIEQQQLFSDCSRLLVYSWIAPALAGHGSQLGHVLVALNYAFLNQRTLVIR